MTHTETQQSPQTMALARLALGHFRAEDIDNIPLAISAEVAAGALHISVHAWYSMIRRGACPLPVLRVGSRNIRHRSADLLDLLLGPSA